MMSVCMATYNGAKYLSEQINSILVQLENTDELIISDDGSTDDTISIIKSFNDNRIKLYAFNKHCYPKNFENALKKAKGDIIILSDQDDIWDETRVEVTKQYLKDYDFLFCNARIIDSSGLIVEQSRNDLFRIKKGFLRNWIKTYYIGCCMAFTRQVLDEVLPFPANSDLCTHDAWIMAVAEAFFKTCVCKECLINYRRHGENYSTGSYGIHNNILRMINIRLYLLLQIIMRKADLKLMEWQLC